MSLTTLLPIVIAGFAVPAVTAQSSFSPARPPAIPIAVSSPYLNSWLNVGSDGGNGGYLAGEWIRFWTDQVTAWTGIIRVDGESYTWLGAPSEPLNTVNQNSFEYTSTKSIFGLSVNGTVGLNVTFLTPVTPTDLLRQSIAATYMDLEVFSIDGGEHEVQLYTDISAEWASGDRSNAVTWDYGLTGDVAYHRFQRQVQQVFTQNNDQAEWGSWLYATEEIDGMTYSSGAPDTVAREAFVANGTLDDTEDTNYRAISDDYPVFAFSIDYGSVDSAGQSTLFTIALAQEEAIQFKSSDDPPEVLSPLWTDTFSDELAMLSFFYGDFSDAQDVASTLDDKITSDSIAAGGDDYNVITSLSVRQAFAATQLAGTNDSYYLFLKEISSDGDIQTVDVIFPSMPIFLYLNPDLLRNLLDPIFIYTEAGSFGEDYALHDLGFYPNATQAGTEMQQLEESGNMVIMTLAYAQRTGDTAYLTQHYDTLADWTTFLVNDSLIPSNQISTDDFAGSLANQTDLAIKGIIGIQAMATIANMTSHDSDGANYSSIALDYITQWQILAISTSSSNFSSAPHTTLNYGANETYGLLYNLYADALLQTNIVPTEIYQMQSDFYPLVNLAYGVPLDTRHTYTKSDWEMFCAAVAGPETKEMLIGDVARFINETPSNRALTDLYDVRTADFGVGPFVARPVVGGHFALLALDGPSPLEERK
ncbi:hypothetical protein AAFC00_006185 [Neodothiora populina]|uniref:Glutaminase n=1 Tax=Neodothiora populina TaxID=2781224 RepID=A0ABR3P4C8_9PEZI